MFIREARVTAAQALRWTTRVLAILALLCGTAYAAELVATGPSVSHRTTADALGRAAAAGLGRDRTTATASHTTRETHRSGARIGATVALGLGALLPAWAARRSAARQSLVWRVLHGYVPRRGPPALRLT